MRVTLALLVLSALLAGCNSGEKVDPVTEGNPTANAPKTEGKAPVARKPLPMGNASKGQGAFGAR